MRAGRNTILLKICQDEEKEDWAQSYQFQLRVCDSNGSGVRSQAISVSEGRDEEKEWQAGDSTELAEVSLPDAFARRGGLLGRRRVLRGRLAAVPR